MEKYTFVCTDDSEEFVDECNKLLKVGYVPQGGMSISHDTTYNKCYKAQAFMKN